MNRRHVLALLLSAALVPILPANGAPPFGGIRERVVGTLTGDSNTATVTKGHPVAAGPRVDSHSAAFSWDAHPLAEDASFAEPSIDVDHSGGIYVTTNGGAGVQMWRSFDKGKTFDYQEIGSTLGGGDSEIEFLSNDVGLTADLEVTDSAVSRSTDRFQTWTQQGVGIEQDRQWLAHRCSNLVLLVYHDFVLETEMVNRSTDGGVTWDPVPILISPKGSAPGTSDVNIYANQQVNTFSGPAVIDQKTGDVYVGFAISSVVGNATTGVPPLYGDPEQIIEAVSHDEGLTWTLHLIKAGGAGSKNGLFFPWTTVDRAGNVYAVWSGTDSPDEPVNVFYSYSTDHGTTWSNPDRVNTDAAGHTHIYASASAGDPGVVDLAWYTASTTDPSSADNRWFVDFAQIRHANTPSPTVLQSRVYPAAIHKGEVCLLGTLCLATQGDRSLLDFFQVQIGPDGIANIAFANNGSPDDQLRVWYARQTAGPSAGSAQHDSVYCAKAAGGPPPLPAPKPAPKPGPKVGGTKVTKPSAQLPGTGVGTPALLAWSLIGLAALVAKRLRRAATR